MNTDNTNIFGAWLKQILAQKTTTGGELAERSRISRAAIYFYLNGSRIPDASVVARIVAALDVSPESVPAFDRKPTGRHPPGA